jgi:hypothetical protein
MSVVLDCGVSFDRLQTEQLPETIGDFYRLVVLGVARATRLNGRGDLHTIQAISAVNGRRVVEEFAGGTDLISGGDYSNAEGRRIHAGCLGFFVSVENKERMVTNLSRHQQMRARVDTISCFKGCGGQWERG